MRRGEIEDRRRQEGKSKGEIERTEEGAGG